MPLPCIAILSEHSHPHSMTAMRRVTIKLPEATLERLRHEAGATGRSAQHRRCHES